MLPSSVIAELEDAMQSSPLDKRVAVLERVTDLFLENAPYINEQQVGLFDDVLLRLIRHVELRALARLSERLAPAPNAPVGVIRQLASHDDILVAGPVLLQSERLSSADLVRIIKSKGEKHHLAIAGRTLLEEPVTDALLECGSREVYYKLAQNHGAIFSKTGFAILVNYAKNDACLAESVGQRLDVPVPLLRKLVEEATDVVRKRLLATAPAEVHAEIKRVLSEICNTVIEQAEAEPRDFGEAQNRVLALQQENRLNEAALAEFAKASKLPEMCAALALLCRAHFDLVERLMRTLHWGGLLVACKAADLSWQTVQIILQRRLPAHPISEADLQQARADYARLTRPTAQRLLGFWQAKNQSRLH
ncbi:MAG TPA: DUF2336 domain-containing protein [Xanthobacteraceae bacterium]|nr:DUF2336 domain-containing protein [Xanthobacteraceae bacterium]